MLATAPGGLKRFSARRLTLAAEAMLWLTLSKLLITLLRFHRVTKLAGLHAAAPDGAVAATGSAASIAWAINAAGRRTPWLSTCLMRALAGAFMLRLRGRPILLVLGVARDPDSKLAAHAWLLSAGEMLTGGLEAPLYQPVGWFSR